jgi:hypothetical protein
MGRELADARFSKGSWWMWQYSDAEGKPYSWERYSVVAVDGDEVLIDWPAPSSASAAPLPRDKPNLTF